MKNALSGLLAAIIFSTMALASEPATLATPEAAATLLIAPPAGETAPTVAPANTDSIGQERAQESKTALPAQPLVQTEQPKDSQKDK